MNCGPDLPTLIRPAVSAGLSAAAVSPRLQDQFREVALETRWRDVSASAEQHHERLGIQAPGGEGERVQRGTVKPLGIICHHEERSVFR